MYGTKLSINITLLVDRCTQIHSYNKHNTDTEDMQIEFESCVHPDNIPRFRWEVCHLIVARCIMRSYYSIHGYIMTVGMMMYMVTIWPYCPQTLMAQYG